MIELIVTFLLSSLFVTGLLVTLVAAATKRLFDRKSRLWWGPILIAFLVFVFPPTYKAALGYSLLSRRRADRIRLENAREQILACRAEAGCDVGQFASLLKWKGWLYIRGRIVESTGQDLTPNDAESEKLKALCAEGVPIAAVVIPYLPDAPDVWLISDFGVSRLCSE